MEADQQVCEYDVFLSFRGPDTRQGFTDVLCYIMGKAGLRVFRDDDGLAVGDKIEKILQAINNSKICIPIFSKTFAQSKWCLREVRRMAKLEKHVVPIFYEVTPDDVKLKTLTYAGFMMEHREKYPEKRVKKWEDALKATAGFKGMQVGDTRYTEFCKEFVEQILRKLGPREKFTVDDAIGLDNQVESALRLLDMESAAVRYVGIYGMGGIGKTTLAKLIYNRCSTSFDDCIFIDDVRESTERHGLGYLEMKLQGSLDPNSRSLSHRESFRAKKLLIVLDDVDTPEQVEKLVGKPFWFAPGSRIVVTSRNTNVLAKCRTLTEEDIWHYKMPMLGDDHSLRLFSKCAFRKDSPPVDFVSLSQEATSTCGGLPLALVVIGSLLRNEGKGVWESVIAKLKKIPVQEIKQRLKISYDKLDRVQQQIFLDIACFRFCTEMSKACDMWEASEFELAVLQSMSLIRISGNNSIWMHDQLRDLGKEIVRAENVRPRKRSRLWEPDEALKAITSKRRKDNIETLCCDKLCKVKLTRKELSSFDNLRFLKLDEVEFQGDLDGLLPELRWLSFKPQRIFKAWNFIPPNLVFLDLSGSSITENWGGWSFLQSASKLKELNLSRCSELERTPQFPENMIIERLILDGCKSLVTVDRSIGNLNNLMHLNLRCCERLCRLPKEIGSLVKLSILSVNGCMQLMKFPRSSIGKLNFLVELNLSGTAIAKLPDSIGELEQLKQLMLSYSKVAELPCSISGLIKLEHLDMGGCRELKTFPDSIGELQSLVHLDMFGTGISELPCTVGGLAKLVRLYMGRCRELKTLPDSIGELQSLVHLDLSDTGISELPCTVGGLAKLEHLNLSHCSSLRALPNSVGLLKSLVSLDVSYTRMTELQDSIGGLEALETIKADSLMQSKFWKISSSCTNKSSSPITQIPHLRELSLSRCGDLRELPKLQATLTALHISSDSPQTLDVHLLSDLVNLKKLTLRANVTHIPTDLNRLYQLEVLELDCRNLRYPLQLPSSLTNLTLGRVHSQTSLPCLSNLKRLDLLDFREWSEDDGFANLGLEHLNFSFSISVTACSENLIWEVIRLKRLRSLSLWNCKLQWLDLSALSENLRMLHLCYCEQLVEVTGLGNLKHLQKLWLIGCDSLKGLEDMSHLKRLDTLLVHNCRSLAPIQGLGNLNRLRSLNIEGVQTWRC